MNLAILLNAIDGTESITIIHCNSRKKIYEGLKRNVHDVDFSANVYGIYTTNGKIVIEAC